MAKKKTLNEVQQILTENNLKLLDEEYLGTHYKHKFQCVLHPDQIFFGRIDSLTRRSQIFCPKCRQEKYGNRGKLRTPLNYEYVKQKFEERGYELISKEYKNSKQKLEYRCPRHPDKKLFVDWSHFNKGQGCPFCSCYKGTSFPERIVLNFLKDNFSGVSDNHYYLNNYEYDIFVPELNLLIEYNGIYWHKDKKCRDLKKKEKAIEKGFHFLQIKERKEKGPPQILNENEINLYFNFQRGKEYTEILLTTLKEFLIDFFDIEESSIVLNDNFIKSLNDASNETKNSIVITHPLTKILWDYEANAPLLPQYFSHGSMVKAIWKCPICGYSWESNIGDITRRMGVVNGWIKCTNCKNIISINNEDKNG